MTTTPPYFNEYANLAFSRDDEGVLIMRFHTDGGPVVFTGQTHEDLPAALEQIALDRDNKALVLTGTGDSFMEQIDGPSLGEIFKPAAWEKTRSEGAKVLQRLVELPMPVVGVANGPATVHSEYLLLADIHIASERAVYGDDPHPAFGITGGDGMQVVWEEVAGTARAKWLLWTGEHIDAQTALEWGVVSEVVEHERAVERGIEIARGLAAKPALYRTLQKQTLNANLRRRITQDVPFGMALEGLTAADLAYQNQALRWNSGTSDISWRSRRSFISAGPRSDFMSRSRPSASRSASSRASSGCAC
jgi:enoyl-CoA hydratase/carnithine racemase